MNQVVDKGGDFAAGAPAISDPVCAFSACVVARPVELARTPFRWSGGGAQNNVDVMIIGR